MMSFEEYHSLDELLQAQLLWIDGVLLAGRKTEKLNVELFSLYGFYVEIFFDVASDDPLYVKAFERTDHLDVYLDQISIDGVLEGIAGN